MNAFNGAVESGAEGATLFAPWSQVNPASGQYSWGSLDRQIAMHVEAGRPVGIMVTVAGFACRGFCYGIAARCMTDGTRSRISWGGELL